MARVTVEDCILKIPNRFELVLLAGQRAREISSGSRLTVDRDNDKNPVVSLREIADETVPLEGLRNGLVQGLQRHIEVDEPVDDEMEAMAAERDFSMGIATEAVAEEDIDEDILTIHEDGASFEANAFADHDLSGAVGD